MGPYYSGESILSLFMLVDILCSKRQVKLAFDYVWNDKSEEAARSRICDANFYFRKLCVTSKGVVVLTVPYCQRYCCKWW